MLVEKAGRPLAWKDLMDYGGVGGRNLWAAGSIWGADEV